MEEMVQSLVNFITSHPNLSGIIICLLALVEALAFVGLVFPGAPITLAIGALIASGALDFASTLGWTILGAILGDGISFWIGHYYRDSLRQMWPLRNYPDMFLRGERFFHKHGGKSIILARFVGPVRPIVPVLAGMLGMNTLYFYTMNIFSACLWAPAYLLPGMLIGSSFILAGEVAGRLAMILGILILVLFLIYWCSKLIYRFLAPHFGEWANRLVLWGKSHRTVGWLIGDLLDPHRSEAKAILLWLSILLSSTFLFFWILKLVVSGENYQDASISIFNMLQQIRTPLGDQLMVILSELGDIVMLLSLVIFSTAWLLYKKAWRSALYLLGAVGFSVLFVELIKNGLQVVRPLQLEGVSGYSFPSGHATIGVVTYGFLAVLIAPTLHTHIRWLFPYATAAFLSIGIAFSRIYLGVHWVADVVAGFCLGLAWIAILTIVWKRHIANHHIAKGLSSVVCVSFMLIGAFHVNHHFGKDLKTYAATFEIENLDIEDWWQYRWAKQPVYRIDLKGRHEQALSVQIKGFADEIKADLEKQGWTKPQRATNFKALSKLLMQEPMDKLPILPQLHNGQYESLVMVHEHEADKENLLVLRLWHTNVRVLPGEFPLWVGTITFVKMKEIPFVRYLQTTTNYNLAISELKKYFKSMQLKEVNRPKELLPEGIEWDGTVLLFR